MAVHGGNTEEVARKYNIDSSKIIDFSANINPLGLNENVKEAMINALNKIEKYPDITYYDLKNSIAEFENLENEDIVLGNGAAEVIFNIVRALKPKRVLLPAPTFSEYEEAVLSIGGEIQYRVLNEENYFNLESNFIEDINEEVNMIFICNPNNPTGVLTKAEYIKNVLEKSSKAVVVIDESFLDFVENNKEYSCKELLSKYNNLIIVKSLTKFFAVPGIRIGYALCKNKKVIESINKVSVPWSVNTVASDGIIAALKEKSYINQSIENVQKEKEYLYEKLLRFNELKVFKPSVNFIMLKVIDNITLKEQLIKHKILIRSCDNYVGLNKSFYRVAVRTRKENNMLLEALQNILIDKQYQ